MFLISDVYFGWKGTELSRVCLNFSSKSIFQLGYLLDGCWVPIRGVADYWMLAHLRFPLSIIEIFPTVTGFRWSGCSFPIHNFLGLYHEYVVHAGFKHICPSPYYVSFLFNLTVCLKECVSMVFLFCPYACTSRHLKWKLTPKHF